MVKHSYFGYMKVIHTVSGCGYKHSGKKYLISKYRRWIAFYVEFVMDKELFK